MSGDDAWYAACLEETAHFLGQFEAPEGAPVPHPDISVAVNADSDIVAALIGLLSSARIVQAMALHSHEATKVAGYLESPVGTTHSIPVDPPK